MARLSGFDEGSVGANNGRPVYQLECCIGSTLDTVDKGCGKLLGHDEGPSGQTNYRQVVGLDTQCKLDPGQTIEQNGSALAAQGTKYRARLIGADRGDHCNLPIRPVFGLWPTCVVPCLSCICGATQCGQSQGKVVCLALNGTDSGIVPLQRTTQLVLPVGFNPQGNVNCSLCPPAGSCGQPFGGSPCVWSGCFTSRLGFTVYVIMTESCEVTGVFASNQVYMLWFIFPCGINQYNCGNWAYEITGGLAQDQNGNSTCPGINGGMTVNIPPSFGRCITLPGVGWGGTITDGNCCPPNPNNLSPPPLPYYICKNSQGKKYCRQADQNGICPGCDQFVAGPFCSACVCSDFLAHNP